MAEYMNRIMGETWSIIYQGLLLTLELAKKAVRSKAGKPFMRHCSKWDEAWNFFLNKQQLQNNCEHLDWQNINMHQV